MNVAFVPSAPLLLPALGGGPVDLRSACLKAIATLRDPVCVVGAAPVDGPVTGTVDATAWGARRPQSADPLPLALAVGSSLLGERPHSLVGVATEGAPLEGDLLVVADGTARRSLKAPGHLDPRAEAFDAAVVAALRAGSPEGLLALDLSLAEELLAAGVPVWQHVARSLPGPWTAEVLFADAPFGVGYVVATWTR